MREAGVAGEVLAAAYNLQLAAWSHAPAAQELERLTLRALARALGLVPDAVFANFTTGGAEANLSAVLAALAHRYPETGEAGVGALTGRGVRPAIYVSSESHHSFVKIARMTGLGTRALRHVPVTSHLEMDPEALAGLVAPDVDAGWTPLMVVATIGTTGTGAVDPVRSIAEVARRHDAWLHVDAAWGGTAALVPRLRPLFQGVGLADSVTWDAHKWLSVPMGAGMFFCRHPESVRRAFGVTASYMPIADGRSEAPADDPFATTVQWSRRAIGLKVFLALAEVGLAGYSELVSRQVAMGDRLRERLRSSGWTVVNHTPLPVVNFTNDDMRAGRYAPSDLLSALYDRGRVWVSDVRVGEERALRACITSYLTEERDVDDLIAELAIAEHAVGAR